MKNRIGRAAVNRGLLLQRETNLSLDDILRDLSMLFADDFRTIVCSRFDYRLSEIWAAKHAFLRGQASRQ
jgi:hypothetical protein